MRLPRGQGQANVSVNKVENRKPLDEVHGNQEVAPYSTIGDNHMRNQGVIRISSALIDNDRGRLLLVRKTGSIWFMQAGGKIELGEDPVSALRRELAEEIGVRLERQPLRYLGKFTAPAANEAGSIVEADIFHLRITGDLVVGAEIEEVIWLDPAQANSVPLAPLTEMHVLPLAKTLLNRSTTAFAAMNS